MTPQQLIFQVRRAKSLVRTAQMLAKGGPSAQRAAVQMATHLAMEVLREKLGSSMAAKNAARFALQTALAPLVQDGGKFFGESVRSLSRIHPVTRELYELQRLLRLPEPSPEALAIRIERLAIAVIRLDPDLSRRLNAMLAQIREIDQQLGKALRLIRDLRKLWKELKDLQSEVRKLQALM